MKQFAETKIDIDEATRRRLILIIEEDLLHGEGTPGMSEVLAGLMYCDRIILEN